MATDQTLRRRTYHQAYYIRHKRAYPSASERRHPCPGIGDRPCGALISHSAKHCRSCAVAGHYRRKNDKRREQREAVKSSPYCPVCRGKMAPHMWHGNRYLRCGACGWEISPREMRRINSENGYLANAAELSLFGTGEVAA